MSEKVTISARVDSEVNERLEQLAERMGWSKSDLIANSLTYGLKEGEKLAARMEGPILGHVLRFFFMADVSDPKDRQVFDEMWKTVRDKGKRDQALVEDL